MKRIEYHTQDKSKWGQGPWQSEPDKIQWLDAKTYLPCLIVRGPAGALCGYVGVGVAHPWHGVGYSDCPQKCGKEWCDHGPESVMDVHGGLTFAHGCAEITREKWEKWRKATLARKKEAIQYPIGDAARALKEWAECLDNYDKWAERAHATHICHTPSAGEPDDVWWFGFDCAHCGDLCPQFKEYRTLPQQGDEYRDVSYVTKECEKLAEQLKEIGG
jgi:hypothetical protein